MFVGCKRLERGRACNAAAPVWVPILVKSASGQEDQRFGFCRMISTNGQASERKSASLVYLVMYLREPFTLCLGATALAAGEDVLDNVITERVHLPIVTNVINHQVFVATEVSLKAVN